MTSPDGVVTGDVTAAQDYSDTACAEPEFGDCAAHSHTFDCGKLIEIDIKVDGVVMGSMQALHFDSIDVSTSDNSIATGTKLGVLGDWPPLTHSKDISSLPDGDTLDPGEVIDNPCWQDDDGEGLTHIHFAFERACWNDNYGSVGSKAIRDTALLVVLKKSWSTTTKRACTQAELDAAIQPDADGHGVTDSEDLCPNDIGSEINNGCPDSDGDGIIDIDDLCPNEVGIPENDGCPPDPLSLIQKFQVDYDSDGDDDILFLYRAGNHLRLAAVWGSSAAGTTSKNNIWEWANFGSTRDLFPTGLSDLDGDGHVDVTFLYPSGNHLRMAAIWGQSGTGVRSSTNNVWEWANFLQSDPDRVIFPAGTTNFDADASGTDDVLCFYRAGNHLRLAAVWGSTGTGVKSSTNNVWEWANFGSTKEFQLGGIADMDDDGDDDITILYRAGNHLRMGAIWGSSGTGVKLSTNNVYEFVNFGVNDLDKDVIPIGSLDFDVDGDDDVVFLYFAGEHLRLAAVWGSTGTGVKSSTNNIWEWASFGSSNNVFPVDVVDLDDDTDEDVVFFHRAGSHLRLTAIWAESGTGVRSSKHNISEWAYFGSSKEFMQGGVLDLDDDGDEDVVFFY